MALTNYLVSFVTGDDEGYYPNDEGFLNPVCIVETEEQAKKIKSRLEEVYFIKHDYEILGNYAISEDWTNYLNCDPEVFLQQLEDKVGMSLTVSYEWVKFGDADQDDLLQYSDIVQGLFIDNDFDTITKSWTDKQRRIFSSMLCRYSSKALVSITEVSFIPSSEVDTYEFPE